MGESIRTVDYFYMESPDQPGEAARVLDQLRKAGVNLLVFSGFPAGRKAQLDFVPENSAAFRSVAKAAKWKLNGPKKGFLIQGDDLHGALLHEAERPRHASIERARLRRESQPRATHAAMGQELGHHSPRGVGRDREADALGHRDDRRVDPDDLSTRVHERPAGVAGIERDVRLDDVFDQPATHAAQRASERAHDAG